MVTVLIADGFTENAQTVTCEVAVNIGTAAVFTFSELLDFQLQSFTLSKIPLIKQGTYYKI